MLESLRRSGLVSAVPRRTSEFALSDAQRVCCALLAFSPQLHASCAAPLRHEVTVADPPRRFSLTPSPLGPNVQLFTMPTGAGKTLMALLAALLPLLHEESFAWLRCNHQSMVRDAASNRQSGVEMRDARGCEMLPFALVRCDGSVRRQWTRRRAPSSPCEKC